MVKSRAPSKLYKVSGFTLIELTIVMLLMASIMGLVGPMTIQQVEKARAKEEAISFKRWVKELSYVAFLNGQGLTMTLNGKQVSLTNTYGEIIEKRDYESLFFQPQSLQFNRKGFVNPSTVTGKYRNTELRVDLSVSINQQISLVE